MSIRKTCLAALVAAPLLASIPGVAAAEDNCSPSRLLLVLDKSSSMLNPIGVQTKWDIAVDAISEVSAGYQDRLQLGLSVFPGPGGACSAGELEVAPNFANSDAISAALTVPPPDGGNWTPIAQTLDAALAEPSLNEAEAPAYVVLITDGWQWCSPYDPATRFAPVDAAERLGAAGITTFVVGFGDGVDAVTLNQMAVMAGTERAGCDPTGATPDAADPCYYQADSAADLLAALTEVAQLIPADEICDGLDNDCDGTVDEDLVQNCESSCGQGVATCSAGQYGDCEAPQPEVEICDGYDNDCDGEADELDEPLCDPGATCQDGQCVGAAQDDPAGMVASGCGCQLGDDADPRTVLGGALPLLFAFGFLLLRRRRQS